MYRTMLAAQLKPVSFARKYLTLNPAGNVRFGNGTAEVDKERPAKTSTETNGATNAPLALAMVKVYVQDPEVPPALT
jgi:hypothetical protein